MQAGRGACELGRVVREDIAQEVKLELGRGEQVEFHRWTVR